MVNLHQKRLDLVQRSAEVGLDIEMVLAGAASAVDYIGVIQDKGGGNKTL